MSGESTNICFLLGGGIGGGLGYLSYIASRNFILSTFAPKTQQWLSGLGCCVFLIGGSLTVGIIHRPLLLSADCLFFGMIGIYSLAMSTHAK